MSPSLAKNAAYAISQSIGKVREWMPTSSTKGLALLWIAHIVLGTVLRHSALLGTAHAGLTLLAGLYLTFQARRAVAVAYVASYIVGSEVLWRMAGADVVWETAKYELVVIFGWTLFRMRARRLPWAPAFYLLLQVPGVVLTFSYMEFSSYFRKAALFNLSGPVALAVAACFFFNLKITRQELWRMVLLLVAPTLSMAAFGVSTMRAMADDLQFGNSSNPLAAGGFGPNQVSAVLGLSTALLLLYFIIERMPIARQALVLGGLLLVGGQSAMTFSRSGLYGAAAAILPALFFLVMDPRTRARVGTMLSIVAFLAILVVVPLLVSTTHGAISKRFTDTGLTGRDRLVRNDLEAWKNNPVFGSGLGMTPFLYHVAGMASHNEFTRLLADHGSLGLAAMVFLLWFAVSQFLSQRGLLSKALVAATFTWSFLFMVVNGFRVAAPAFAYGLGCVAFVNEAIQRKETASRVAVEQLA